MRIAILLLLTACTAYPLTDGSVTGRPTCCRQYPEQSKDEAAVCTGLDNSVEAPIDDAGACPQGAPCRYSVYGLLDGSGALEWVSGVCP